jgi:hypothetical protein
MARYRSAGQLSDDIQRHLERQPVLARGDTSWYRAGKFLQRFRIWVIAAAALAAAMATGQVTVRPVGALYIAGALAVFALWYAATDKEIGARIAESRLMAALKSWKSWAFLGALWGIGVVSPAWAYAVVFLSLAMSLVLGIAWLTRSRWTGRLLLDLNRPRHPGTYICLIMPALVIGVTLLDWFFYKKVTKADLDMLWTPVLPIAWLLDGRLEARERGILYGGRLLPWGDIESCEWLPLTLTVQAGWRRAEFPVLKVHLRRVLKVLPPAEIPIPPEKRQAVETLLSRQLSIWPEAGQQRTRVHHQPGVSPKASDIGT